MINFQTFTYGFFLVVITLDQVFTGFVVFAFNFWRVEDDVVSTARSQMHATATHATDDFIVIHGDFNHRVNINALLFQCIGLSDSAWETVKQETIGAISFLNTFFHQTDNDVI